MPSFPNPCAEEGLLSPDDSSESLDVHVDLLLEDTLRAGWQVFLRRARVGLGLYAAAIGLVIFLALPGGLAWPIEAGVLAAAAAALLLPGLAAAFVYRQAKSDFAASADGVHVMQYHFCRDGVGIETLERPGWFEWDAFDSFLELRSCFLLFASREGHYVIPKRCLRGPAPMDRLRMILQRRLGAAASPKRPAADDRNRGLISHEP